MSNSSNRFHRIFSIKEIVKGFEDKPNFQKHWQKKEIFESLKEFVPQNKYKKVHNSVSFMLRLSSIWEVAVGEQVKLHTQLKLVRNKVLHVIVDHPVWKTQLGFLKKEILHKINSNFKDYSISDIKFTVGELKSEIKEEENTEVRKTAKLRRLKKTEQVEIENFLKGLISTENELFPLLKDILENFKKSSTK